METQRKYAGSRRLSPAARRVVTAALVAATIGAPTVAIATEPAVAVVDAEADATQNQLQGTCGATDADNVAWKLSKNNGAETYTLDISGSGAMKDYSASITSDTADQPWRQANTGVAPTAITKVVVGEGVTKLGNHAFDGVGVVEYDLPASLDDLGSWSLSAGAAKTFNLASDEHFKLVDGVLFSSDGTSLIAYPGGADATGSYVVPSTVTTIGPGAFVGCDAAKVVIPSTVTKLSGWSFNGGTIEEIDVNASATLPTGVFANAKGLKSVLVGPNVKGLSNQVFYGCSGLVEVSLPGTIMELPSQVFSGCTALKEIDLPSGLKTIKGLAFQGCSALESISLPEGLESIEGSAFGGCTSLTRVTIPSSVSSVGWGPFQNCASLTDLTIASGSQLKSLTTVLTGSSISHLTFEGTSVPSTYLQWFDANQSLRTVSLPNVESVGDHAFEGAKSITSVEFGNSLREIGQGAFSQCVSLKTLEFPDSLETIGSSAFSGCTSLSGVTYGSGIKTIESGAFDYDKSLSYIDVHRAGSLEDKTPDGSSFGNTSLSHTFGLWNLPNDLTFYTRNGDQAEYLKRALRTTGAKKSTVQKYVVLGNESALPDYSSALANPVLGGKSFGGWYTDLSDESTKVTDGAEAQDEGIYYAKWNDAPNVKYTVSGDLSFDSIEYGVDTGSRSLSVTGGDTKGTTARVSSSDFDVSVSDDGATITVAPKPGLHAGTYSAKVYVTTPDGLTTEFVASLTVDKAQNVLAPKANVSVAYQEGASIFDAHDLFYVAEGVGHVNFEIVDGGTGEATVSGSSIVVTKVGTIVVKASTSESGNFAADNAMATLTVTKAAPSVSITVDGENSLEVTGATTVKVDSEVKGGPAGAKVVVSCDNKDAKDNGDGTWSLPNKVATYTFTASYAGDDNHEAASATATVKVTRKSTGGGGGTVVPTPTKYKVSVADAENGTVKADKATAAKGDRVTLVATAAEGYRTSAVTVTDASGKAVSLTLDADGTYSFEMPASDVKVVASFARQEAKAFPDVDQSAWYAEGVAFVSSRGIMGGYPDGTFGVGRTLTRAEFAQLLYKRAGGVDDRAAENETGMADVADSEWYTAAANWAVKNGVINGYADAEGNRTGFGPNDPVTMEQLVAILANLADKEGPDKADTAVLAKFQDPASVSPWATKSVAWAVEKGLIHGSGENGGLYLHGSANIMRERVATIFMNAFDEGILSFE